MHSSGHQEAWTSLAAGYSPAVVHTTGMFDLAGYVANWLKILRTTIGRADTPERRRGGFRGR